MSALALEMLRKRYTWPAQPAPDLTPNNDGWCGPSNERVLATIMRQNPCKLVIELGSFAGLSTRFILRQHHQAEVICIDTWEGGADHDKVGLSRLFDQFVVNMWPHREQCTPLRMTTVCGLWECKRAAISPGMIYIDAGHRYEDVAADLETAANLFPHATLCGDDFLWDNGEGPGVARAVEEWCARNNRRLEVDEGRAWWVPEGLATWLYMATGINRMLGEAPVQWHQYKGNRFTAYPDGTAEYGQTVKGTWTRDGNNVVFQWENGQTDTYEIDAGGSNLRGMNSHFQPITAKGVRRRQIPA
jgi:hypothetical protein